MLFNSYEYLIFLPVVFLLYWLVFRERRWQNLLIVAASYVFYGWWDWRFLLLITFTMLCSYASGRLLENATGRKYGKQVTAAVVAVNLAILGVYKYYDFFAESFCGLLQCLGFQAHPRTLGLILPVGISFYTFQALSYTVDVYRRKISPVKDVVAFAAFISFFPQLVAGPIERATHLLPQFLKSRSFRYDEAVDGMRQILWGLFKKMVVADNCAVVANRIFADYGSLGGGTLWVGAFFFTFQIYGDFSGYSDIAIGTAKLFGIRLVRNFNVPYFSRNIAEFWRRWHISLNTWFVDYVYIPLGGSREGKWKSVRNTGCVFFLSGLWHGANWTYIAWGMYHSLLFLPLLLGGKNRKYRDTVAGGHMWPTMKEAGQIAVTFVLVLIGWVVFRAESLGSAYGYIARMFTHADFSFPPHGSESFIYIAVLCVVEWLQRNKEHGLQMEYKGLLRHTALRWSLYLIIFASTFLLAGKQEEFIYFQF